MDFLVEMHRIFYGFLSQDAQHFLWISWLRCTAFSMDFLDEMHSIFYGFLSPDAISHMLKREKLSHKHIVYSEYASNSLIN